MAGRGNREVMFNVYKVTTKKKKKKKTTPTNYIYTHHFDKSRGGKPKTLENSALLSATWEKKTA